MRSRAIPFSDRRLGGFAQFCFHLRQNVGRGRQVAPLLRPPARVHQDHAAGQPGHGRGHLLVPAQRAHVIHDLAAGVDRGARHLGFVCIHGENGPGALAQHVFHHGHDAAQLFRRGNPAFNHGRSRPRGFSANVQQVSAVIEHFERVGHGMVAGQEFSAVRK